MNKLEGKIALITGGTNGIGLATAKEFVNEGAFAFITGRRDAQLTDAAKKIEKNVTGVQGDVSRLGDLDRPFAQIKREKGKIDVLFANGGFASFAPLEKITEAHYDSLFNTNVKGLLFTVLKAIPLMPDGSAIILNASIVASKGLPDFSVYSATNMSGLAHPMRSLRPWCFSRPTTAVTSPGRNCLLMVVSCKSDCAEQKSSAPE